jgi:hypothetical protein
VLLFAVILAVPRLASAQIAPHTFAQSCQAPCQLQSQESRDQSVDRPQSSAQSQSRTTQQSDPAEEEDPSPLGPQIEHEPYHPITTTQRFQWFVVETLGPKSLIAGVFTAGYGTAVDKPRVWGPGWAGFGDRYGMRLTGIATSNLMEASLGVVWQEDPRYFRVPDEPFPARIRNVIRLTFYARERNGNFAPAFGRFIAIPGSNFLSNTWRPNSEADTGDALQRTVYGFAGRMASNAFSEFWPDVKSHLFHRHRS